MKRVNDKIWWNGKMVPWNEALVHVTTETASRGLNVFEGLKAYWNDDLKQFLVVGFNQHFNRMKESLKIMQFENCDISKLFEEGIQKTLSNCPRENIYLRPTVCMTEGAYSNNPADHKFVQYISWRTEKSTRNGTMSCKISDWIHLDHSNFSLKAKVGAMYSIYRNGRLEAMREGYDEAIFLDSEKRVAETGGGSVFSVKENRLRTPPLTQNILASITREIIIKVLCPYLNIQVKETPLYEDDLEKSDEIFIAGTLNEIVYVNKLNDKIYPKIKSENTCYKIQELFWKFCRKEVVLDEKYIAIFDKK